MFLDIFSQWLEWLSGGGSEEKNSQNFDFCLFVPYFSILKEHFLKFAKKKIALSVIPSAPGGVGYMSTSLHKLETACNICV